MSDNKNTHDATIVDGKVVLLNYVLKNDAGEQLDSSDGEPMPYLHGYMNIVPGLESALTGKVVGDKLSVVVEPANGYGELSGEEPQAVPREEFPPDYEIVVGDPVVAETDDGQMVHLWVVGVDDEFVHVTMDHPLAGENLHFDVEVVELRDATAVELEHGHPHGPDGTHAH